MKVCVIGTINKDLILPFNHAPIESFGGIFYNVSVLAELLPPTAEIVPVSFVGEDIEETVRAVLDKKPNVSLKGLQPLPQKNHKVILEYMTPEKRQEKSLFPFPSLEWQNLEAHMDADIILLNLISGWDISKKAFEQLKKIAADRLYIDIHYLMMGVDKIGRRIPKLPDDISSWLLGPRFVQMNEQEFQQIAGETLGETEFFSKYMTENQVLIATKGSRGVVVVFKKEEKIQRREYKSYQPKHIIDATGCGDTFGAAFIADYIKDADVLGALDFANRAAAANLMLQGTNEMHLLAETMGSLTVSSEDTGAPR